MNRRRPAGQLALERVARHGIRVEFVPGGGNYARDGLIVIDPVRCSTLGQQGQALCHQSVHAAARALRASGASGASSEQLLEEEVQAACAEGQFWVEKRQSFEPQGEQPTVAAELYTAAYQQAVRAFVRTHPSSAATEAQEAGHQAGAAAIRTAIQSGALVPACAPTDTFEDYYRGQPA